MRFSRRLKKSTLVRQVCHYPEEVDPPDPPCENFDFEPAYDETAPIEPFTTGELFCLGGVVAAVVFIGYLIGISISQPSSVFKRSTVNGEEPAPAVRPRNR